jgi:dTDP-glucose 4,6-dehydratase
MDSILITGGAGFIGSNFVHHSLREWPARRLIVVDALTYAGRIESLQREGSEVLRFVEGNICDTDLIEGLLREERIDTLVHFAAESHVDRSISGPDAFVTTNVVGTHSLLKAARRVWLEDLEIGQHRFHHVSTDEVYGSLRQGEPAFHEGSSYAPNSPYAATKAASDHIVRAYHRTYGLPVTTSNCSNNYGPYQFPEKLIPRMIVSALHGLELPVYGDGCNVRDWIHVSDHCRALDLILQSGVPGEVYAVGGESECENLELVQLLCRVIDAEFQRSPELRLKYPECPAACGKCSSSLIRFVPDRPGHDRRYAMNCEKIKRQLGYRAQISLEEGIRATLSWYAINDWWWRDLEERRKEDMSGLRLTAAVADAHSCLPSVTLVKE